jgi:hypothetical protein
LRCGGGGQSDETIAAEPTSGSGFISDNWILLGGRAQKLSRKGKEIKNEC